jgi:hypothetical protein
LLVAAVAAGLENPLKNPLKIQPPGSAGDEFLLAIGCGRPLDERLCPATLYLFSK